MQIMNILASKVHHIPNTFPSKGIAALQNSIPFVSLKVSLLVLLTSLCAQLRTSPLNIQHSSPLRF